MIGPDLLALRHARLSLRPIVADLLALGGASLDVRLPANLLLAFSAHLDLLSPLLALGTHLNLLIALLALGALHLLSPLLALGSLHLLSPLLAFSPLWTFSTLRTLGRRNALPLDMLSRLALLRLRPLTTAAALLSRLGALASLAAALGLLRLTVLAAMVPRPRTGRGRNR